MKLYRVAVLLLPLLWYGHHPPGGAAGVMLAQSGGGDEFTLRVVLDLNMQDASAADIHEKHHIEVVYGPQGWPSCPPGKPGEECNLRISQIHGNATGWNNDRSRSSRIDSIARLDVSLKITRNPHGVTVHFPINGVAIPLSVDEFIGNCAAQPWEPSQIDLSDVICHQPDGSVKNYLCSTKPKGGIGKAGKDCFGVAAKGGMYSGNDQCLMRYDMTNFFEDPHGNCQWQHNGKSVTGSLYGQDPPGMSMCQSPRGTGVNDASNPHNKAGDASRGRGDCIHKFCLNNKAHGGGT